MTASHWLDLVTAPVAPRWTLKRQRARMALEQLRHYEGASVGRRTQGWRKSAGDANTVNGPALALLRAAARDLVRNNPYAESAVGTIADHTVGWGIVGKPAKPNKRAEDAWREWAETTICDADGRHDFYGVQKLVTRSMAEAGECLVRRRVRLPSDGLKIPMQLQVLDPDFLDTDKDNTVRSDGNPLTVQGVQYDGIGRRTGYWLFPEHPGSNRAFASPSQFVPASSVLHVFRGMRPGQSRGVTWFAPVLLRFKDFDEYEDATLMKQKIAACLAVLTTDTDGSAAGLGTLDASQPTLDYLEPGLIKQIAPGQTIEVVQPPQAGDYTDYSSNVLRAIATGLGVTHEDLTGNYSDMPFSAARMSRLRHEARVYDWRWRIIIPQLCDPVWAWFVEVAAVAGLVDATVGPALWTPPPLASVDPDKEGKANSQLIRNGLKTWSETIRESGQDPKAVAQELAADNALFDRLNLKLDCDPRVVSQQGQVQVAPKASASAAPAKDGAEDDTVPEDTGGAADGAEAE